MVFIFCLIIFFVTMISIEQIKNPRAIGEFIGVIVGCILSFSLFPIIWLIILIRNEKVREKIFIWIEDSVELTAYSKKIGVKYWIGIPLIKIQVEFEKDGIKYVRTSEKEEHGKVDMGRPIGYFAGISKYVDRKIKILYSPKYDQVMVLKD